MISRNASEHEFYLITEDFELVKRLSSTLQGLEENSKDETVGGHV